MAAKGCEGAVLEGKTNEELTKEIKELSVTLQNAFSQYETDMNLVRNPRVWVDYIENAIERAICILKLRNGHPALEPLFARLEESYHHADEYLPGYAKKMKLPGYTD